MLSLGRVYTRPVAHGRFRQKKERSSNDRLWVEFVYYFSDGNDANENCDHKDDGEFDGETRHTYITTGSMTLWVIVGDKDSECCHESSPNHGYGADIDIVVVRADIDINGVDEANEFNIVGYVQTMTTT